MICNLNIIASSKNRSPTLAQLGLINPLFLQISIICLAATDGLNLSEMTYFALLLEESPSVLYDPALL